MQYILHFQNKEILEIDLYKIQDSKINIIYNIY